MKPRRCTYDASLRGSDFQTKRAWGMEPEERPAEDFGKIIEQEKET